MKQSRLPYWLIAPSAIFLIVLFVWPLAETALMAFRTPDGVWTTQYLSKMTGDLNFSEKYLSELEAVTAADVQRWIEAGE